MPMISAAITVFFLTVVLLYIVCMGITASLIRTGLPPQDPSGEPRVSVIMVAKDEEPFLPECLAALKALDYPQEKIEFVLVNDRSTDRTGALMDRFVSEMPNAAWIDVHADTLGYTGKIHGLIQGIRKSRGEFLFFTDADCKAPPSWIRTTLDAYSPRIGAVGGYLVLDRNKHNNSIGALIQSLDWILLSLVGSAWAFRGHAMSAFGNNLSVRRSVYAEAGGFESVDNDILEDSALIRNIQHRTSWLTRILVDKGNAVCTQPCRTLSSYCDQRKRWAVGGRRYDTLSIVLMVSMFLAHVLIPLMLSLGRFGEAAAGFAVFVVTDVFLFRRSLMALGRTSLLWILGLYRLYQMVFAFSFAPAFFFGREIRWKKDIHQMGFRNSNGPKSREDGLG